MLMRKIIGLIAATQLCGVGLAYAEVSIEAADTCIAEQMATGDSPLSCIEEAQADCGAVPENTPSVAVLCYTEAKSAWSAGIAATMESFAADAPRDAMAISQIEAKYDLLSGFMQCDRMEELALAVSTESSEAIARQKAHCTASSAGVAYARLSWRISSLK